MKIRVIKENKATLSEEMDQAFAAKTNAMNIVKLARNKELLSRSLGLLNAKFRRDLKLDKDAVLYLPTKSIKNLERATLSAIPRNRKKIEQFRSENQAAQQKIDANIEHMQAMMSKLPNTDFVKSAMNDLYNKKGDERYASLGRSYTPVVVAEGDGTNDSLGEGAEEVGASLGRGIDQMVAQIKMLHRPAIDQIIKALGGYTQKDYNKLRPSTEKPAPPSLRAPIPPNGRKSKPREDDPDFGAA